MASAAELQLHWGELAAATPVLPFATAPRVVLAPLDAVFASGDAEVARALQKSLLFAQDRCTICGCGAGDVPLAPLLCTRLDFAARAIMLERAPLACGMCRALSNPSLYLQLALPAVGCEEDAEPEVGELRSAQLQALQLHFAAVNRAPPSITGNTDALAVWTQGLACRAYGLRIMAGSIKGWRVLGPHDSLQHIELAEPGEAVRLMCECLVAGRRSRRSSSSNDDVRSSSGASAGGKLKRKRKGGAQASAAARMPASTPDPPLTPTLQRGTDESRRIAVAAAAAADERDGSLTAGGSAACKRAAGLRRPRLQVGDGAPQAMSAGGTSKDAGRCKSSMHASTGVEARKRRNRSC